MLTFLGYWIITMKPHTCYSRLQIILQWAPKVGPEKGRYCYGIGLISFSSLCLVPRLLKLTVYDLATLHGMYPNTPGRPCLTRTFVLVVLSLSLQLSQSVNRWTIDHWQQTGSNERKYNPSEWRYTWEMSATDWNKPRYICDGNPKVIVKQRRGRDSIC